MTSNDDEANRLPTHLKIMLRYILLSHTFAEHLSLINVICRGGGYNGDVKRHWPRPAPIARIHHVAFAAGNRAGVAQYEMKIENHVAQGIFGGR